MSFHGGYGLMLQISEASIQGVIDSFYNANKSRFQGEFHRTSHLPEYGLQQSITAKLQLTVPRITFLPERGFQLSFSIVGELRVSSGLSALDPNSAAVTLPDIVFEARGDLRIQVDGHFETDGDHRVLWLDLSALILLEASIAVTPTIGSGDPHFTQGLVVFSRRAAIAVARHNVAAIPASFPLRPEIPYLQGLGFPVELNYKIVTAAHGQRALAILLRVQQEPVNYQEVAYTLAESADVGVFFSFAVLNSALSALAGYLEDYDVTQPPGVDPNNPSRHGQLTLTHAQFHVEVGRIVVDNINVHLRILDLIQRKVREVVCYLLGGACGINVCDEVIKFVTEDVLQLDQLGHVSGWLELYVDSGKIKNHPHLTASFANWMYIFIPLAAGALIPAGATIGIILMVIGYVFANRKVNSIVSDFELDTIIDKVITGTNMRLVAGVNSLQWFGDDMAIFGTVRLVEQPKIEP